VGQAAKHCPALKNCPLGHVRQELDPAAEHVAQERSQAAHNVNKLRFFFKKNSHGDLQHLFKCFQILKTKMAGWANVICF
jgi:hypothetical protein